jgi:hypothetical protein
MVAGSASYSTSALTVGNHNISAVYSSDMFNKASQAVLTQSVSSPNKSAEIGSEVATAVIPTSTSVEPTFKAYPNPFTEKLNVEFSAVKDTHATLEIYTMSGSRLEVLFDGPVFGGDSYSFEYLPRLVSSQIVLYKLTMDGKSQVGKVMYNERR